MSESIVLTRSTKSDPWLDAVALDYEIPADPHVFVGTGLYGERVAAWVGPDGGGFACIDSDPDGYVKLSAAFQSDDKCRIDAAIQAHGGVDEYVLEPGCVKYDAKRVKWDANTSFGGIDFGLE